VRSQGKLADHPTLDKTYKAELMFRVAHELLKGPCDLACLVRGAEGAYPSDVLAALDQLETAGEICLTSPGTWRHCNIPEMPVQRLPDDAEAPRRALSGLPEPHPLDFDWRFSALSLTALHRRMNVAPDESVAVLGAPTLYKYLVDSGVDAWLFDKNAQVIRHLKEAGYTSLTECDLFDYAAAIPRFHWAVADPPWYIEHYRAFLDAGRTILLPEGKFLISVLPRLTRPSAATDRFQIVKSALQLGFDLVEAYPGVLHYESPPFEVEALRAEDLTLREWRRGDLFSFVMRSQVPRKAPRTKPRDVERWESIPFGETTVKIKVEQLDSREPFDLKAASATGGFRLRSVSRRSPTRSRINLWTSRNVALTITKPAMVAEILHKVANGSRASEALAVIAYGYQLSDPEVDRLRQLLELLASDAKLI
jgi:hypothetical protein